MTSPTKAIESYMKKSFIDIHKELKEMSEHDIFTETLSLNILDFSLDFITSTVKEVHLNTKKGMTINSIDMYNGNIRWAVVGDAPHTLSEMISEYKGVYKSMLSKHWCEHVKYIFKTMEQAALSTFATLSLGVNCIVEEDKDGYVKITSSFNHNRLGSFEVSESAQDPRIAFVRMLSSLYEKFLIHMRKDFKGFNHAVDNLVSMHRMIHNTPYDIHMDLSRESFNSMAHSDRTVVINGTLRIHGHVINIHLSYDPKSDETFEELTARFNEYATTVSVGYELKRKEYADGNIIRTT